MRVYVRVCKRESEKEKVVCVCVHYVVCVYERQRERKTKRRKWRGNAHYTIAFWISTMQVDLYGRERVCERVSVPEGVRERARKCVCVCVHVRWRKCVIPDFKGLYNGALADIGVVA